MKVIDLTKKIKTGMEIYPGDPEVNIKTVQRYPWKVSELNLGTHTGTHVDAFSHVKKEGKSIDDIPLTSFFGEAQLIGPDDKFPKGIGLFFTEKVTSSHTAEPWGFPIGNLRSTTHLFFRLEGTSRSIEQIG